MNGEVRLWRSPKDFWLKFSQPSQPNEPYIALPAAEFEAWRRVVEAAIRWKNPDDETRACHELSNTVSALVSMREVQQPGRAGGGA